MTVPFERRRLQRVKLLEPLAGKVAGQRVFILDISRSGVRVAHQESLGAQGELDSVVRAVDSSTVALTIDAFVDATGASPPS